MVVWGLRRVPRIYFFYLHVSAKYRESMAIVVNNMD